MLASLSFVLISILNSWQFNIICIHNPVFTSFSACFYAFLLKACIPLFPCAPLLCSVLLLAAQEEKIQTNFIIQLWVSIYLCVLPASSPLLHFPQNRWWSSKEVLKMLMQWTTSRIRLILVLYLVQSTRPCNDLWKQVAWPWEKMCIGSFSSSHLMPARKMALVASEEHRLCLEFLLCILSKLSDLVNSPWRSRNSGIVENVCKLQREGQISRCSGWAVYLRLPYSAPVVPRCWLNSEVVKTAPYCSQGVQQSKVASCQVVWGEVIRAQKL